MRIAKVFKLKIDIFKINEHLNEVFIKQYFEKNGKWVLPLLFKIFKS